MGKRDFFFGVDVFFCCFFFGAADGRARAISSLVVWVMELTLNGVPLALCCSACGVCPVRTEAEARQLYPTGAVATQKYPHLTALAPFPSSVLLGFPQTTCRACR